MYTTRPSAAWPGYTDILIDGVVRASTPRGQEAEMIAYLTESSQRHYQRIIERLAAIDPRLVIARGNAYSIGSSSDDPKGFGGSRWITRFHDGREVITDSLWHLGDIPAEWRNQLPDNADLRAL